MPVPKKIATIFAALALAMLVVPGVAFADEEVVTVATVDDFAALAQRVSAGDTMKGVTVQQVADVDFSGVTWVVPIGTKSYPFEGTYDGQGFALENADVYRLVNGVEVAYLGLFGKAQGATFRNMVVRDLSVWIHTTNAAYEALLCAVMNSCTVENCDIQGAVGAESGPSTLVMGGLCTEATDCMVYNTSVDYKRGVKDTDQFSPAYPSAVFARKATRCSFQNCHASGTITNAGSNNAGSLVATLIDSTMDACSADVSITSSVSSGSYSGGLVGSAEGSSITNCVNRSKLNCSGSNVSGSVGGLVGFLGKCSSLTACSNEAELSMSVTISTYDGGKTSETYAGGLVGVVAGGSVVSQCVNSGAVSAAVTGVRHAYSSAGGLIGKGSIATISDCYNIADVHVEAQTTDKGWLDSNCIAGGIAANLDEQAEVSNCYNAGMLSYKYLSASNKAPLVDGICPVGATSVEGCFYYRCACESASTRGTALTVIDMMKSESFAGWDFEKAWRMDDGAFLLPVLQWEAEARDALLSPEILVNTFSIEPVPARVYNGKAYEPKLKVSGDGIALTQGVDFRVSYSGNVNAGTATAVLEGWGAYLGQGKTTFKITKAPNPLKAKVAKAKFKKNKKKKQTTTIKVSDAKGKVKFTSNKKKVKVSASGKVTIAKGFKGKAKITVKAAGDGNYNAAAKTITIKVK